MTILIPGGHLTPALALIEYLEEARSDVQIVFAGRKYSQDQLLQESHESHEVGQHRNTRFVLFAAPRGVKSVLSLFRMLKAVWQAFSLIQDEEVDVLVSFGGYQAVPFAVAAAVRGIPIVTHEQTRVIGYATRFIGQFAQRIALSFESSRSLLPHSLQHKAYVTGNPLRPGLRKLASQPGWWCQDKVPVVFVTGGNQGALVINQVIKELLPVMLSKWIVIHQCGNATIQHNYQEELHATVRLLPTALQQRYMAKSWFTESELAWIWQHATVVVGRAGANTITEFVHFGVPAILIPLPTASQDEQTKNAEPLVSTGAARSIPQSALTPAVLHDTLQEAIDKNQDYRRHLEKHRYNDKALHHLWSHIEDVASP